MLIAAGGRTMATRFKVLAVTASLALTASLATGPVIAQTTAPPTTAAPATEPDTELQTVVVSASAISIAGYDAPTPVTAVGLEQLQSNAHLDIGDAIRSLPAFANSPSPENSEYTGLVTAGIQGEDLVNLRNLGINRTLVLFDGQRVVQSNIQGGVDISTIPSMLIERIENVTGGASATWGSDALSGVVNLIINKRFNGAEINLTYGNNTQGLHSQGKAELALGTDFAGDRGHIEAAGSWWYIPKPYFTSDVEGWQSQRLVSNPACSNADFESADCPAGQPVWLHANGVGLALATRGGLITGPCMAGAVEVPCGSLTNVAFGQGGVPYQFNPGNTSLGFYSNGGTPNYDKGYIGMNAQPLQTRTGFVLASFKINDGLRASLQFNYGTTSTDNNSYTFDQYGSVLVHADNPFIPASVGSYLGANGIDSFYLGTTNENNFPSGRGTLAQQKRSISIAVAHVDRRLLRGVFTLDGAINDNWTWNAYYQQGQSRMHEFALNNTDVPNMLQAEDAVLGPGGVPTCRVNVDPTAAVPGAYPGCVPINIFGEGVASQQAIDYVNGPTRNGQDFQTSTIRETVAAGSIQGKLPWGLSAGQIALAAGVSYRSERGKQINCGVNCDQVNFSLMNFARFGPAGYNIKEGYGELNIPVLKDSFVRDLSLDIAGRISDYSNSGSVTTYKFGVVSQLVDAVRFRASYSYDIRAPDLFELFSSPTPIGSATTDPRTGQSVNFYGTTEGNPKLKPEYGETKTFGFVFTPLQGMNVAIDYYHLLIGKAINEGFGSSSTIAQCVAGDATFCERLIFGSYPNGCSGPTLNSCPPGPLAAVISSPVNFDRETTSGIDFNADYRFHVGDDLVDINSALNYVFAQRYFSLGVACDVANSLGWDAGFITCPAGLGTPKLRGNLALSYNEGGWLATVQERVVGKAHLNTAWENGVNVDNNDIPAYFYTDVRLNYRFDNGLMIYGAVDNVTDKIMPIIPGSPVVMTIFDAPYRDDVYDGFGRVWRAGVRWKLGGGGG